jgi:diguanylate cyclase (GGDEF)-like protein
MENDLTEETRATILIVDDEPANLKILSKALEGKYEIMCAISGQDAMDAAKEEHPDLILLDVMMPEMDGYQVCTSLKADPSTAGIPVIFLTGLTSNSDEAKGLEIGAVDYISKPINVPIVCLRVSNHIKLTRALAKLKKLSTTDGLTELANRRHMDMRLARECNGSRRPTQTLSVILMDIDHFKAYNDTYGHQEGDKCLKRVSDVLSDTINRHTDMVARYGGEEFCCILPSTLYEDAMAVANKIRTDILALKIPNQGSSVNDYVTMSLGVVTVLPDNITRPEKILAIADKNLYAAKESGRNCVTGKNLSEGNLP